MSHIKNLFIGLIFVCLLLCAALLFIFLVNNFPIAVFIGVLILVSYCSGSFLSELLREYKE